MGLLFSLDGRMQLIACLLFYLVMVMEVLSFCKKPYQTLQTDLKIFKKIKMLQQEHTKGVKCYYYIVIYPLPVSPLFSEGGNEISKNWVGGTIFENNLYGKPKSGRQKKWAIPGKNLNR